MLIEEEEGAELEQHDLFDDSDYAASQFQGLSSSVWLDSGEMSRFDESAEFEVVYSKDKVAIHPTQMATERISGRLHLVKQGSLVFLEISRVFLRQTRASNYHFTSELLFRCVPTLADESDAAAKLLACCSGREEAEGFIGQWWEESLPISAWPVAGRSRGGGQQPKILASAKGRRSERVPRVPSSVRPWRRKQRRGYPFFPFKCWRSSKAFDLRLYHQ
ncbi:uncharacterized protein A4U43_C05F24370 [Asparagus officinalis]|uniref:Uncharacterized protein n=1 Tax=Asparagus officinalis TaxID=4686 RepID=A0A5P1EYK8_ASPOF|nr:uncharacterized protein A4U43_C05F24370 [Asparagus officinalis]